MATCRRRAAPPRRSSSWSARCWTRRACASRSCRVIEQLLRTPLTDLVGVRHPVVQTGMGWVSGPRLVSGTANAGGLGILASATMTLDELEKAIVEVRERTDSPFGVNLRADAGDAADRCDLLIEHR